MDRLWVIRFLRWFCPQHLQEEIEGDLLQRFERDLKSSDHPEWHDDYKLRRAKRRLLWNTIRYFRPGILLRHADLQSGSSVGLYLSYTRSTYRLLKKQPVYTALNLVSLTLGICVFLWTTLTLYKEWSYDKHFKDANRIYRVTMNWQGESDLSETRLGWSLSALPEQLRTSLAGVEHATGLVKVKDRVLVKVGNTSFLEEGYYQTDTCYFNVFEYKWEHGNPNKINRSSIVLTSSLSKKYFGNDSPVGHRIEIENEAFEVMGVIQDVPANSSFRFKALVFTFDASYTDWGFTFFKIRPDASVSSIGQNIKSLFQEEYASTLKQSTITGSYHIEPLMDIHMGEYKMMDSPKANRKLLALVTSLAAIILFISLTNYSNLTTSLADDRQRESTIRIVLGAAPGNILIQSIIEATMLSISALFISSMIIYLLWSALDEFLPNAYSFDTGHILWVFSTIIFCVFIVACLSGFWSYQKRRVVSINKPGLFQFWPRYHWLTGLWMTFQFCITLTLLFSSRIILDQLQEVTGWGKDSHQNQSLVVNVPHQEDVMPAVENFARMLQQQPYVMQASLTGVGALPSLEASMDIFGVHSEWGKSIQTLQYTEVDATYFDLFNLNIVAGRPFTEEDMGSWEAVIVSESYVKQQGWSDDPLQHRICYGGICDGVQVVGVVRDALFWGLQQSERPMLYYPLQSAPEKLVIKLSLFDPTKLDEIKSLWLGAVQLPFDCQFFDQYVAKHVEKERKTEQQISLLAGVSILLIALGFLGVVHVQLTKRKKAIALRKVFGATLIDLLKSGWRDQLQFLLIAVIVSYPLAWLVLQSWLAQFTSKTSVNLVTFLQSLIPVAVIILFALIYHGWKLGRMKSLDIIRYE
ncbi:MAG: ABC transporter permease [Cyclobacteriaceae bacterium]|nr:ABC transporter permease [Cyclobacteriaceae bacterium]